MCVLHFHEITDNSAVSSSAVLYSLKYGANWQCGAPHQSSRSLTDHCGLSGRYRSHTHCCAGACGPPLMTVSCIHWQYIIFHIYHIFFKCS